MAKPMTFEEWCKDDGMPRMYDKDELRAAWHAGFYQGRVHESGNNMAKQMDDALFGHLKLVQESEKGYRTFKNTRTGELIYTNLTETVDDFRSLLNPNDYVEIK